MILQPGYRNIVPVKKLPKTMMDERLSGIFRYYEPILAGVGHVFNAPRPTATMLLSKTGGVRRVNN